LRISTGQEHALADQVPRQHSPAPSSTDPSTDAAIAAITRRGLAHARPPVRLVEVGQMAGPTIALPAEVLRGSGLEVLGSGPGTIPARARLGAAMTLCSAVV
jgi:hypothetical protein